MFFFLSFDIPLDNITYWENPCKQQNVCFVKFSIFVQTDEIRGKESDCFLCPRIIICFSVVSYMFISSAALSFRSEEISFTESVDAAISSVLAARLVILSSTSRMISAR